MAAELGDEAEAVAKRLAEAKEPGEPDDSRAERLRWLAIEFCRAYAKFDYAAPALRCIARTGEAGRVLAPATRVRIELAAAMAKAETKR